MKGINNSRCVRFEHRGFALVVTIVLLGLITLVLLGLASIGRVEIQSQINGAEARQARTNAEFALNLAIGQLQRYAARDDVLTVRADHLGSSVANHNWTAVLSKLSADPLVWLVNGPESGTARSPLNVASAPTGRSGPTVQLLSRALTASEKVTLEKSDIKNYVPALGDVAVVGRYAYWAADESQKVSLGVRADLPAPAGLIKYPAPDLNWVFPGFDLNSTSGERSRLIVTDQALLISGIGATKLTSMWPQVTANSRIGVSSSGDVVGAFNVNSPFDIVWEAVLAAVDPVPDILAVIAAIKTTIRPFLDLKDFETKLGLKLGAGGADEAKRIRTALGPILTVRGETYYIRAYGETINPLVKSPDSDSDSDYVKATAICEAMVQLTVQPSGASVFNIVYFRWLNLDAI